MSSLLVIICDNCGKGLNETERIIQDERELLIKVRSCPNCIQKAYEAGQKEGEGYERQAGYNRFYGHEMGR